jgi:hypothetical protein
LALGLGISRLVFRALNATKILLATLLSVACPALRPGAAAWALLAVNWLVLATQIGILRPRLDSRAQNFRQLPIGVVVPRTPEATADAVAVAREHERRSRPRGGGTSLAGQCTNAAVVIDWIKSATGSSRSTPPRGPAWCSRASCSTSSTGSSRRPACGTGRSRPPT